MNRIDAGNVGGTRLVAVDTTSLIDGSLATVFSVGARFELVKSPSAALLAAAADPTQGGGITIVASTATPGTIWCRVPGSTDARFSSNMPLFIDPAAGNDDNDGYASDVNALKTADEWCRRMNGQELYVAGTYTVNCAAGNMGNFGPCSLVNKSVGAATAIVVPFLGAKSVSAEVGTVSVVTPQNTTTQQEYTFTDSSGTVPVMAADSRLRITAAAVGANVGGVGYVRGFVGGDVTKPYTSAFVNPGLVEFFPAAGDRYVVETLLTTFGGCDLKVQGLGTGNLTVKWQDLVQGIGSGSNLPSVVPGSEVFAAKFFNPTFMQCIFGDPTTTRLDVGGVRFIGCEFKTTISQTPMHGGLQSYDTCVFRAGAAFQGGNVAFTGHCVFEAASSLNDGRLNVANAGSLLFSRILAGTGLLVGFGGSLVTNTAPFWSPPIGARNGMALGISIDPHGTVNLNVYATVLSSLSATVPVSSSTRLITSFYGDEATGAYLNCTDSSNGSVAYRRSMLVVPNDNPIGGAYRFAAGGSLTGRGSGGAVSSFGPAGGGAAGHASFTGVRFDAGPISTVGATLVTIATFDVTVPVVVRAAVDGLGFLVKGILVGIDGTGNVVSGEFTRSFKRIAGVLTALGAGTVPVIAMQGDAAITGAVATLDTDGANLIRLRATGVAATTIAWNGALMLWSTDFVG